jgi:hypothetical protein
VEAFPPSGQADAIPARAASGKTGYRGPSKGGKFLSEIQDQAYSEACQEIRRLQLLLTRAVIVLEGMYDAKPSQAKARFWTYWMLCPELVLELRKAARIEISDAEEKKLKA